MFGFSRILLLAIAGLWCRHSLFGQDIGPIGVVRSGRETAALVEIEGCKASLEWIATEKYLRYRNNCDQDLNLKMRLFSALAEKLEVEFQVFKTSRTLAVGRLSVTFPALARQISLAAFTSPKWDIKRGRAAGSGRFDYGADNSFFGKMAIEMGLFEPIDDALKPFRLSVRGASVEKVLAGTPMQLPFGDWLLKQGVAPTAKLLFDGQTWLRLESIGGAR